MLLAFGIGTLNGLTIASIIITLIEYIVQKRIQKQQRQQQ